MIKSIKLFFVALAATMVAACSKMPENGDLDGQWQLLELQTKTAPEATTYDSIDYKKDEAIYWRFHNDILMIFAKEKLHGSRKTLGHIVYTGNQLKVTDTYIHYENRDSLLTDPNTTILEGFGIRGNKADYDIEKLNSKHMILHTNTDRLVFRKF